VQGPESFVLIERDEAAQRLILAWPNVAPWPDTLVEAVRAGIRELRPALPRNHHRRLADWAQLAGVAVAEAYRCESVLLGNEFCLAGGAVDPNIAQLVQAALFRRLGGRPAPRRPTPPSGSEPAG